MAKNSKRDEQPLGHKKRNDQAALWAAEGEEKGRPANTAQPSENLKEAKRKGRR